MTEHDEDFAFEDTEAELPPKDERNCPNVRWFDHPDRPAETCRHDYCAGCCRSYRSGQLGGSAPDNRHKDCTTPAKGKP